jgi:hypothetical protein
VVPVTARENFDDALQPIRLALEADGYAVDVEEGDGGRLAVKIRAGEGACEECLVGPSLLRTMIDDTVSARLGAQPPYVLVYPDGSATE